MTVLLLGIGADATNCAPTPRVYEDGTFDYIPIPEANGPDGTSESRTYGSWPLSDGRTAAAYLEHIRPTPDADRLSGEALATWPVHHDPNFEVLTYGETISRAAYVHAIRDLEPGDIVAFYTGLVGPDSSYRNRYIIGWFTVDHVLDCQRIPWNGTRATLSELPAEDQEQQLREYAANAHAKRFVGAGELRARNDGLVIVEGREPGGLLERAVKISERRSGGHYYMTDEFVEALEPAAADPYLGGIKQSHVLGVDTEDFLAVLED